MMALEGERGEQCADVVEVELHSLLENEVSEDADKSLWKVVLGTKQCCTDQQKVKSRPRLDRQTAICAV